MCKIFHKSMKLRIKRRKLKIQSPFLQELWKLLMGSKVLWVTVEQIHLIVQTLQLKKATFLKSLKRKDKKAGRRKMTLVMTLNWRSSS